MDCNEARWLLHAGADGELGPADLARLDPHLASCPACAGEMARIRAMRDVVREGATYHRADTALRARLMASLPAPPRERSDTAWGKLGKWIPWGNPARLGLALAMVLAVAVGAGELARYRYEGDAVAREMVASHVRALLSGRPLDVASLDQHTVKPWFNGKLDFSPPVVDLAGEGFPLVGGRVDYVDGRVVAALIYRRHGHVINVFVWPAPPAARTTAVRDGYNIEEWSAQGLQFSAVSDVNAADLTTFRDSFIRAAAL
jgi:anti-sigma factor RsiW